MSSIEAKPSALIIAPKRSGTNYTHDILAPAFSSAVNEPLGLHNDTTGGKRNPLDPWAYSSKENVSLKYGHTELADDPLGSLLSRSFIAWLTEGNKLIKETDFLHLGWLLASVPLKIMVIRRDPRESIASFKKYGLFHKWGYQQKMQQFSQTITDNPALNTLYGGLTNFEEFTSKHYIHQLAIYYAIAFLEIDRNTKDLPVHSATYEDLVNSPKSSFQTALRFFGKEWSDPIEKAVDTRTSTLRDEGPHGTFRSRNDLTHFSAFLSSLEADVVAGVFNDVGIGLAKQATTFNLNLESDGTVPFSSESIPIHGTSRQIETNKIKNERVKADAQEPLFISQKLITNEQYAHFLSWLLSHNIPLSLNGKPIFYNDRPQGRIRRHGSKISIEKIYSDHPVNFINWIGAALYCSWVGGRLPTGTEWEKHICPDELLEYESQGRIDESKANIGQFYSDTTPVDYFSPNKQGVYDAIGNMSIWLQSDGEQINSFEQQKAGVEWNHTPERGIYPNPRPYWLGTSGLGVRPVFTSLLTSSSEQSYLKHVREIIDFLGNQHHNDTTIANKQLFDKIRSFKV